MYDIAYEGDDGDRYDDQSEDEERGVFACFFSGMGDAEGIDEGVGKEVEKAHGSIMRLRAKGVHPRGDFCI